MNARACSCLLSVLGGLSILLSGCVSPYPAESDFQQVVRGEKSIVIIGLRTRWNGKSTKPMEELGGLTGIPLHLSVASFDEATGMKQHKAYSLVEMDQSGRQWTCLFLAPGSYYVWSVPPGWMSRDVEFSLDQAGGFWLQVYKEKSIQYAGTLCYDLEGDKFIEEKFYHRFACSVIDERQDALAVAQKSLASYGHTVSVSLMLPYGQKQPYKHSVYPALVVTHSPDMIRSPDWKARAADKAFGPVTFILSDGSSGYAAIGAAGLAIAYYPIGLTLSSAWAAEDIKRWEPCVEALNDSLELSRPDNILRKRLAASMGNRAVIGDTDQTSSQDWPSLVSKNGCRSLLLADIGRIQLRECEKKTYCVEVAARIRLWDLETNRLQFDWVLVYTNPKGIFFDQLDSESPYTVIPPTPMPCEIQLDAVSPSRPMQDYCGRAGVDLFNREINLAIDRVVSYAGERLYSQ